MSLICNCPVGASLPNIPLSDCPESLGQIQKAVFQRVFSSGTTKNGFAVATADPKLLASWTPLLAATDGTKVVQSPFLENPVTEPGAKREFGGGNATLGGIPIVLGAAHTKFTAVINRSKQDAIAALKSLACENVGVFLVDENGYIAGIADDLSAPANVYPIPIRSLFVGDKKLGGFEEVDSNVIEWNFKPNWSDNLYIFKPTDFDPLTDLVTP